MAWEAVADTDQLEEGDMMLVQLGGEPICVVRLSEDEAVAVPQHLHPPAAAAERGLPAG